MPPSVSWWYHSSYEMWWTWEASGSQLFELLDLENHAISMKTHGMSCLFKGFFFAPKYPSGLSGTTIHHSIPSPRLACLTRSFCSPGAVECNHQGLPQGALKRWVQCDTKTSGLLRVQSLYHTGCIMIVSAWYLVSFYFLAFEFKTPKN